MSNQVSSVAIDIKHVSKSFKLPHEKSSGIKQALVNVLKRKKGYEVQHVLDDISFQIKKGEFFGIVGRNGSGKSTLLKMLAGIYEPNKGSIDINGTLTPFIELGVGFNPELTGRENVFLNGALLGFDRHEMKQMYDDIVGFAELERFMDQKLKNYSSGMQVRLAFSIAIRANTDILVLDEVLAVGDEAFQKKCIAVFESYKLQKKTIILVTHDMSVVERFCDRAVLIKSGKIVKIGSPRKVAIQYSNENLESYSKKVETKKVETKKPELKMVISNAAGETTKQFTEGDRMTVVLSWKVPEVQHAGIAITRESGEVIFGPNTFIDEVPPMQNENKILYSVELDIAPGEYYLQAAVFARTDADVIARELEGPRITVMRSEDKNAYVGLARLEHSWKS